MQCEGDELFSGTWIPAVAGIRTYRGREPRLYCAGAVVATAEASPTVALDEPAGNRADELIVGGGRRQPRSGRSLVGAYAVTVFVLITLNFFLPRAMPGDPITALIDPGAPTYVQSDVLRAELEQYYGLDRPLLNQYVSYLGDLAQGDLGTSIRYNRPVTELIKERLPWTLLLIGSGMALAALVGLVAGIHSGWHRGRPVDQGLLTLFLGARNFPVFFLASIALFVFAVKLGWVPLAGARTPFAEMGFLERVGDITHHLVLPASVLATRFVADNYLYMRAAMVGELGSDHLLAGRAKGLREHRLKYRYGARNALLPVVTTIALQPAQTITASIFVETVFAYPGMGRLLFESVGFRDYPTLQGCFLLLTLVVVTANFLVDLVYLRLDPRTAG